MSNSLKWYLSFSCYISNCSKSFFFVFFVNAFQMCHLKTFSWLDGTFLIFQKWWNFLKKKASIDQLNFFSTDACNSMSLIDLGWTFFIWRLKNLDFTKIHFHHFNTLPLESPKHLLYQHVYCRELFFLMHFFSKKKVRHCNVLNDFFSCLSSLFTKVLKTLTLSVEISFKRTKLFLRKKKYFLRRNMLETL